jgi:hypothetical protein
MPAIIRITAVRALQYLRPGWRSASQLDYEATILPSCIPVCRLREDRVAWGDGKQRHSLLMDLVAAASVANPEHPIGMVHPAV